MQVIGIIPARYSSQRLPAKPLADICGKPMIQWVYEQAKKSQLLNEVIVATDNQKILDVVKNFGGKVVMTPECESGSDRVALVARTFPTAQVVVNIQGDEPLISPQLIDECVDALIKDGNAVVATAVKKIESENEIKNPNVVKVVLDKNNYALYFSRAEIPFVRDTKSISTMFYKHYGIYIYRANFLQHYTIMQPTMLEQTEKLEQLRILENGFRIKCVITEAESFSVDTQEDLEHVRTIMNNKIISKKL